MITAAQIVGVVSVTGATEAEAGLLGVGAVSDASAASLALVEGASASASAFLSSLGARAFTTGVGFDGLAGASVSLDASLASVDATAAGASASLAGVGSQAAVTKGEVAGVGEAGLLTSAAIVAFTAIVAGVSANMAANFQQAVNRLKTGAGDTQDSFAALSAGILKVSTDTGQLTGPLTKAMYDILSSGQRGAQAFSTLAAAAKGAVIEQANVVDVSDTLAGAMTNFGTKVFGASDFMNGLVKAVSLGRITLQNLSTAMGPIEPVAHAMGISFSDLAAAMSTQTNAAIPAERAATGLRFMMQALEVPTKKAKDAMTEWGISSVAVANEMKVSLPGALQMIYDAAKKAGPEGSVPFNRAVSDMVGGQRSLATFLALTGDHMKAFQSNANAIAASMKSGSGEVSGWALAQSNFNVIMDKGKAAAEAAAITLGTKLLPVFGSIVSALTPVISKFAEFVAGLNSGSPALAILGGVLAGLAVIILAAVVPALISLAGAILAAEIAGAPAILVILGIAAAVAGIILVIQHWAQIMQFLGGVLGWIGNLVGTVFSAIGTKIHDTLSAAGSFVGSVFSAMGTTIHDKLTDAKNVVGQKFSDMGTAARDRLTELKNTVGQQFSNLGTLVHDSITGTTTGVVNAFHWMYDHNTYVKAATDAVGAAFSAMGTAVHGSLDATRAFVGNAFDWIGTHIRESMTGIKNTVGSGFDWLGSHVHSVMATTASWVGDRFSAMGTYAHDRTSELRNSVGSFFDQMGTHARDATTSLWNNVTSAFRNAWGGISGALNGLWNNFSGWFNNLAGRAYQWGANALGGFINGFKSMMGNLGNALGNAASSVANFLGFHSPTREGPGRDADRWAPNLVKMFASGLLAGIPSINAALSKVMAPALALSLAHTVSSVGTAASAVPGGLASLGLPANYSGLAYRGVGSSVPSQIIVQPPDIYLDGVRLSRGLMPYTANAIRYNTGRFGV